MKFFHSQKPESWKANTNMNNVIVSKNVKNSMSSNTNTCKPGENCFKANPLKHYRKQYTSSERGGFSRQSFIGSLDKPGANIVTSNEKTLDTLCATDITQTMSKYFLTNNDIYPNPNGTDKFYDSALKRTICTACNPQSLVIKSGTTVLDNAYSSSHREYINRRCKSYTQNLPTGRNTYTTTHGNLEQYAPDCANNNNCNVHYYPSNRKYSVQGPVSSSTRIASLKYNCSINPTKCKLDSDYNNKQNLSGQSMHPSCVGCKPDIKKSKINILQ
jgi:hypothetical protein